MHPPGFDSCFAGVLGTVEPCTSCLAVSGGKAAESWVSRLSLAPVLEGCGWLVAAVEWSWPGT